ncbi:MAG: LytTR family transcriptional regulator [Clostridiales Family XIII bacterium]|nr:LytTR family transcriptional regulator [Clostridiales Family XIII bacterium]
MKIRIEIDEKTEAPEIIIRCSRVDAEIARVQNALLDTLAEDRRLLLTKEGREYYLPPEQILFFESASGKTFAHTADETFEIKMRLYEIEEILPRSFIRVSKSAIVGTEKIYSIEKNITGPSTIRFRGSHKQITASRQYFKILQEKLGGNGAL